MRRDATSWSVLYRALTPTSWMLSAQVIIVRVAENFLNMNDEYLWDVIQISMTIHSFWLKSFVILLFCFSPRDTILTHILCVSGCYKITTVFSHAQTVVLCVGCSTVLCQPTGGKARLTEGNALSQIVSKQVPPSQEIIVQTFNIQFFVLSN